MQDIIFPKHKKAILESLHDRQSSLRERGPVGHGHSKKYLLWGAVVVVILSVLWYTASAFATADVYITPHQEKISFNDLLVASSATTTPQDAVSFQIMTLKDQVTASVPATKKESVSESATGIAVLYNLTTTKQRLVVRTRLEASSGKLYRLMNDVTVPPRKVVSGKTVPGSVEARIQAALPGESYNSDLTDFTIPGFKGTAKYSQFYGRSKTKISGGFMGDRLIASPDALSATRAELKVKLADQLSKKAVESIPDGWVMYKDGTFLDLTENQSSDASKKDAVAITENGTLRAVILKLEDILAYAVNHKLKDRGETTTYKPEGFDGMKFSITNRSSFNVGITDSFTMSLAGEVTLISDVPTELIKADLAGQGVKSAPAVFRKYPGVQVVSSIKIHPSFITNFPGSKDKISIHINQTK